MLNGLDLDIAPGEFVALLGRSGSGKSTLLRALAGLDRGVAGTGVIEVPEKVSVVFQDSRLLPWKRVLDNVTLGLRAGDASDRGRQALAEVGLAGREKAWPHELSGGEQQRAALARSLVRDPQLLLADEPFGALDALTRIRMHALLRKLCEVHQPAVLLVTHDVDEAIVLADRVIVLDGRRRTPRRARRARRPALAGRPGVRPAAGAAAHRARRRGRPRRRSGTPPRPPPRPGVGEGGLVTSDRQLHLNLFIYPDGHHEAAWRHPDSETDRILDISYYQELAQRAEAAKFDAVFFADGPSLAENIQYAARFRLEPITVMTAIAAATERIGLIGTASTTYNEPYNLARQFASLDHLSKGRAGWNIVTTGAADAARNFGLDEHPLHARPLRAGRGVRRRRHEAVGQLGGRRGRRRPGERDLRRSRQDPPRSTTSASTSG